MTLKVFQNSYSVECWWTASEGRLSCHIYIYELDLLWVPNLIVLGIYILFWTKFFWNVGIDTCFNVKCVLLGRNFYFLCGYLLVTALYLVVASRYGWLLLAAARYYAFQLLVWTLGKNKNNESFPIFQTIQEEISIEIEKLKNRIDKPKAYWSILKSSIKNNKMTCIHHFFYRSKFIAAFRYKAGIFPRFFYSVLIYENSYKRIMAIENMR